MKYDLRQYQQVSADLAVEKFRQHSKPFILVLATGAGKSLVIADVCHQLNEPVLILQPNKEILEQNYQKLQSYGITDVSIYSASLKSKVISKYTYATIGSIYKKPEDFQQFKYVILDECHQLDPKNPGGMLLSFLNAIGNPTVLGLTATPYRLSQKYFKENGQMYYTSHLKLITRVPLKVPGATGYQGVFWKGGIIYTVETAELIEQKYLSPILYRADREVDMLDLKVNSTGADFDAASVEAFWNDSRLKKMARVIQRIDEKCQRNLIFCSSIRQAERACDMLSDMGIGAGIVTGTTPMEERTDIVDQFRRGEIKHMLNVGVFTTGFDVPELDCIVLARPTMSLALYYQMVGRGVRLDPKRPDKKLRIYDLAGVVKKLGAVETIRLQKEDGYKDMVVSDAGRMDETPLFKYLVKKRMFAQKGA